jgi:integrase
MNAKFISATAERQPSAEKLQGSSHCGPLRAIYVRDGQFRIHVISTDGLPEIPLTAFANELFSILSESSVPGYIRELLQFVNWSRRDAVSLGQGWDIYGDPCQVRNAVREYLTVAAQCRITVRPDTLGLRAAYINATSETSISVRLLLASLKKLYDVLGDRGFYSFPNPMVHEDAARTIAAFHRGRREAMRNASGRLPMPAVSGVDDPPSGIRLSQNYFRLVNTEWLPRSIDDPGFPSHVYAAGREYGWSLREMCAARTLFESGARISEVFDLTAADWSISHFMNRFTARNKGSCGQRVKMLVVSQVTAKLYRRYFNDKDCGRLANDRDGIATADLNSLLRSNPKALEEVRIFLTARGTSMSSALFRDHYWKPALRAAGIDADPHIARHWFVTNALRTIETTASDESDLNRRKQELIQYMSWRSGERTMKAYEHVERGASFGRRLQAIHRTMRRRELEAEREIRHLPATAQCRPAECVPLDHDLAFLLGEDDDD